MRNCPLTVNSASELCMWGTKSASFAWQEIKNFRIGSKTTISLWIWMEEPMIWWEMADSHKSNEQIFELNNALSSKSMFFPRGDSVNNLKSADSCWILRIANSRRR